MFLRVISNENMCENSSKPKLRGNDGVFLFWNYMKKQPFFKTVCSRTLHYLRKSSAISYGTTAPGQSLSLREVDEKGLFPFFNCSSCSGDNTISP